MIKQDSQTQLYNIFEFFIGFTIALLLWTWIRFAGSIGPGEILLVIVTYCLLIALLINIKRMPLLHLGDYYALWMFFYFCFVILMMTLINFGRVKGTSILEWSSYFTSASLILCISMLRLNYESISKYILFFALIFTILSPLLVGDSAWYAHRFRGPSFNPNRLALYMMCLIILISQINFRNRFIFFVSLSASVIIAYLTGSDALRLGLIATSLSFLFLSSSRSIFFAPIAIMILLLILIYVLVNIDFISSFLSQLWYAASTSNIRVNLLTNGIDAWNNSIASIFFGYGAGAYSGFTSSFQGWEAHSTVVDLLSISGLIGLFSFYFPALYAIVIFIKNKKNFAASAIIGLVIFSLFGYFGRYPLLWFTLYVCLVNAEILRTDHQKQSSIS